jgi:hypothetical protein
MRWRFSVLMLGTFSAASLLSAQHHNCPTGFDFAGTLHGSGSYGVAFNEIREIDLPPYATIDTSFQQSNVRVRGGSKQAQSNMHAKDIPKGIYLIPSGSTLYDNGWAVSAPELQPIGSPTRYRFAMKLYCISSSNTPTMHYGGCDVNVDVCYKPKH